MFFIPNVHTNSFAAMFYCAEINALISLFNVLPKTNTHYQVMSTFDHMPYYVSQASYLLVKLLYHSINVLFQYSDIQLSVIFFTFQNSTMNT